MKGVRLLSLSSWFSTPCSADKRPNCVDPGKVDADAVIRSSTSSAGQSACLISERSGVRVSGGRPFVIKWTPILQVYDPRFVLLQMQKDCERQLLDVSVMLTYEMMKPFIESFRKERRQ